MWVTRTAPPRARVRAPNLHDGRGPGRDRPPRARAYVLAQEDTRPDGEGGRTRCSGSVSRHTRHRHTRHLRRCRGPRPLRQDCEETCVDCVVSESDGRARTTVLDQLPHHCLRTGRGTAHIGRERRRHQPHHRPGEPDGPGAPGSTPGPAQCGALPDHTPDRGERGSSVPLSPPSSPYRKRLDEPGDGAPRWVAHHPPLGRPERFWS